MAGPILWGNTFGDPKEPIIGKDVNMSGEPPPFLDCQEQITIEDWVFFGHGVMILTGSHDYTKFYNERQVMRVCKPVTIKEGAWVGSRAIILQGVTIGEHAVVGAGSVVTHDVEPYTLVAGNPAKFIKKILHD